MKKRKKEKEQSVSLALKPEQGSRGIWQKSLKPGAQALIGWESPTSMLVTRVNRWSLTYYRCLGIEFQSQKSGEKSEELVVERSLKLDWLGVIDGSSLHGPFRKQYL